MDRANHSVRWTRALAPLLLLAGLGCRPEVVAGAGGSGGDGSGGQGGGGTGGAGGAGGCASYDGDGCSPGQTQSCGLSQPEFKDLMKWCDLDAPGKCSTHWSYQACNTPLVLSFDDAPIAYELSDHDAFDLDGTRSVVTDWPTAATPWLAMDRDGSGAIENGSELFGSMSPLTGGRRAANGFEALAELDSNGDGRISRRDPAFANLLVWRDSNGDRCSSPGELVSAADAGLVSIELGYSSEPRCDARGNCEVERATFVFRDARGVERTGAIVDVHLAPQL